MLTIQKRCFCSTGPTTRRLKKSKKKKRKKKFPNITSVERNWQNYRKLLLELRTVWMATAFLLFLLPTFRPFTSSYTPSDRILTCAFQSFAINKNGERYIRDQRKKKKMWGCVGWTRIKGTTDEGEDSKEEVAWEVDRWFPTQRKRTLKSEEEVYSWCAAI